MAPEQDPPSTPQPSTIKVAVIGLGLTGLACVKNLLESGFDVTAFERDPLCGGLWRWTPDERRTSVLKVTQANTSKQYACFQDFPFPDDVPDYPSAAQVLHYLESYADHFQLLPHCHFNTRVRLVERSDTGETWRVKLEQSPCTVGGGEEKKKEWVEIFDKVVVATGAFARAFVPEIEGMADFQGKIIHAQGYKGHGSWKGARVAVVGLSNSGCDIAVDLSSVAAETWLLHRSGGRIVERSPGGVPQDHALTRRLQFFLRRLPSFLQSRILDAALERSMRRSFPNLDPHWGLLPALPDQNSTTVFNDHFIPLLHEGEIKCLRASVKSFTATGLQLELHSPASTSTSNGDRPQLKHIEVDAIVLATGYRFDYSPLSSEADPTQCRSTPEWDLSPHFNNLPYPWLYQTIFSVSNPYSLAFLGPCAGYTFAAFKAADLSSQAIARTWAGENVLPDRAAREKWCERNYSANLSRARKHHLPQVGTDGRELESWLNQAAGNGVEDSLGWGWRAWVFWWRERRLWKCVMDGIDTPFVGRLLEGQRGARTRWEGAGEAVYKANSGRVGRIEKSKGA